MAKSGGKRSKQQERLLYLQQHRDVLERVSQHCVNRVLCEQPPDPYAALLDKLSEHTKAGVRFGQVNFWPSGSEEVCCEVVAWARGIELSAHRAVLPRGLVASGLRALAGDGLEENAAASLVAADLSSRLCDLVCEVEITDFPKVHQALCSVFGAVEEPPASEVSGAVALRSALEEIFLVAAGRLLGDAAPAALRSSLVRQNLPAAEPMNCQLDLAPWQHLWPRLLQPALQGGKGGRRLCVGVSLWAATLPEAATSEAGGPEFVDEAARLSREASADGHNIQADEDQHDPGEYCPPLNCINIAAKLCADLVKKVVAEGPSLATEDDFASALSCFQKVLGETVPSFEARLAGDASGGQSLLERQQSSCIFCALDLDAGTVFQEEGAKYCFAEGATERSAEELAGYYAELCRSQPSLRMLLRPFAPKDSSKTEALAKLRTLLPEGVVVIEEEAAMYRNLDLGSCGLVAQYQGNAEAFSAKPALYDFTQRASLLPSAPSYLSVSLTLQEASRSLVLPKVESWEELEAMLRPLSHFFRQVLSSMYAETRATDGREKNVNLGSAQFREGLTRLGWVDAEKYSDVIFELLDWRKHRSLSASDLAAVEQMDGPASLQQLDTFRLWLCDAVRQRQASKASDGGKTVEESPMTMLVNRMDASGSGSVSFGSFHKALKAMHHPSASSENAGQLREVFMSLDLSGKGSVSMQEFSCLSLLSARYQLKRVALVRAFLEKTFGSHKAAFKAIDEDRKGSVSADLWLDAMIKQHGYQDREDLASCLNFIDKDGSRVLTSKEFEVLGGFSEDQLVQDLKAFRTLLEEKHGSLRQAYEAFAGESSGAAGVDVEAFVAGCRSMGLSLPSTPRLLFNFLDAMHFGRLQCKDFLLLDSLDIVERLQRASDMLRPAILSIKALVADRAQGHEEEDALALDDDEDAAKASVDPEAQWVSLHKDLRDATEGEIF
mmetsp:Transcript_25951/g.86420  ORF Transcript_25951/g.86420 Transcript_25951/m.86420 type:complete len:952 (-) Transcript_25951:32-2887(-)